MDFYSKAENVQGGKSRNAIIWQNSRSHGQACDWTITSALPAMCVCNYSVCIYSVCACCLCMQLLCVQLLSMRLWRSSQTICISTVVFYNCAHNRQVRASAALMQTRPQNMHVLAPCLGLEHPRRVGEPSSALRPPPLGRCHTTELLC